MTTTTAILALAWTQLPMLGWLALAAAPVVIHLLSRRRYRVRDWAAMQFLEAAMRESRQRLRVEQLLLLVVRTLVIVLIVLAVAGPYLESSGLLFTPAGVRTHRVLVLDGSYSMGYTPADVSRFDYAKTLAAKIVDASPQGDGFSLVVMGEPPRVLVDTPALEADEFLRELEAARRTDGTADLAGTLEKVDAVLREAKREQPGLKRQEVYFLTDLCRVGWASRSGGAAELSVRRAKEIARRAKLMVIDVGQSGVDNLAVTRLGSADSYVTLAAPVELELAMHNFGPSARGNVNVDLLVDSHRVARRTVDLPSGQSRVVRLSHSFDSPGDHVVEARLAADRLAVDNRRWLVLPVRRAVDVLCVDGRPGGELGGASGYLAVALAPGDRNGRTSAIRPTVVSENALLETDLSPYDCVFLCNVGQVTAREARVLGQFVRAGGGLVVFLGDRVLARRYNDELYDGEALLPARLHGVTSTDGPGVDPLGYAHEIVEPFRGRHSAGLLGTPIEKLFKLAVAPGSKARVVLATRGGDPLVVEQPVGRGRVVLVATSADTSWTAMPLWTSYVPLVQEIVKYAVAGRLAERNVAVGETLAGSVPPAAADDAGRVALPDGAEQTLVVRSDDGRRTWSFGGTDRSGVYTVRFGADETRYGVNVDTVESDLTKLSETQLRDEVWPGVPLEYETTWHESTQTDQAPIGRSDNLAAWLLCATLVLLLTETILARHFGHQNP